MSGSRGASCDVRAISRRAVLGRLGAGALAATLAPNLIVAGGGEKPVVVGGGDHAYEVVRGWGKLPDGVEYGNTHGVQVDSQGLVLVHNTSKDSVCIFDPDGKFIKSWGEAYADGAHGFQLVREGKDEFLYLALTGQHIVVKTTLDGDVVWKLDFPRECDAYEGKPDRYVPTNIAIAPKGDFYIADGYGLSWVHQYDRNAKYIRSWGGAGKEPGKMNCPHGIWVDTRGPTPEVVVADRSNVRLQYFSLDGKHLRFVVDELRHPCHFDQRGGELLIPDLHGRVTIFNKENRLVTHLGDNADPSRRGRNDLPPEQWVEGQFVAPHAACWDRDGNIYVAEWVRVGRVTKLRKVG